MTDQAVALVVLAAGQGSRMLSDLPKVLHRLGGVPLVGHALAAGRSLDPERVIVVAGHGADAVGKAVAKLDPEAQIALQEQQLGTGHAVAQALPELLAVVALADRRAALVRRGTVGDLVGGEGQVVRTGLGGDRHAVGLRRRDGRQGVGARDVEDVHPAPGAPGEVEDAGDGEVLGRARPRAA